MTRLLLYGILAFIISLLIYSVYYFYNIKSDKVNVIEYLKFDKVVFTDSSKIAASYELTSKVILDSNSYDKKIVQEKIVEKTKYTYSTQIFDEIIIYWSPQDEAFIVEVPELAGCGGFHLS